MAQAGSIILDFRVASSIIISNLIRIPSQSNIYEEDIKLTLLSDFL